MGIRKKESDLGSVTTYVISPTRALLVFDEFKRNPFWKCPGGKIETYDSNVIAAAIRETQLETGVELLPEEVELFSEQWTLNERYHPYRCVARISEEKLKTRKEFGDEDGHPIKTGIFSRTTITTMTNLLKLHRPFIREVEQC